MDTLRTLTDFCLLENESRDINYCCRLMGNLQARRKGVKRANWMGERTPVAVSPSVCLVGETTCFELVVRLLQREANPFNSPTLGQTIRSFQ